MRREYWTVNQRKERKLEYLKIDEWMEYYMMLKVRKSRTGGCLLGLPCLEMNSERDHGPIRGVALDMMLILFH